LVPVFLANVQPAAVSPQQNKTKQVIYNPESKASQSKATPKGHPKACLCYKRFEAEASSATTLNFSPMTNDQGGEQSFGQSEIN